MFRRFKFILVLLLTAAALHVIGNNLRGVLSLAAHTGALKTRSDGSGRHARLDGTVFKHGPASEILKAFPKRPAAAHKARSNPQSAPKHFSQPPANGPRVLKIVEEEPAPPLNNPYLSEGDAKQLSAFLLQTRRHNTALIQDVTEIFGLQAAQELTAVTVRQETALEQAAQTARQTQDFFTRAQLMEDEADASLLQILNRYPPYFHPQNSGLFSSAPWKRFFQKYQNWKRQE